MPELFAGPLVRWYRQDFSGGTPPTESPDPDDVALLVARWREAFAPAIGPVTWLEPLEGEVRCTAISDAAWTALLLDAAAPTSVEAALAKRPRDVPAWPLLMATVWIPAAFDGILPIGLPDQPHTGALASVDRLAGWVTAHRLKRWAAKTPRDDVDATLTTLGEIVGFAVANRTLLVLG